MILQQGEKGSHRRRFTFACRVATPLRMTGRQITDASEKIPIANSGLQIVLSRLPTLPWHVYCTQGARPLTGAAVLRSSIKVKLCPDAWYIQPDELSQV